MKMFVRMISLLLVLISCVGFSEKIAYSKAKLAINSSQFDQVKDLLDPFWKKSQNPDLVRFYAESMYQAARNKGDLIQLKKSYLAYKKLTKLEPDYSRAWFYLGLIRYELLKEKGQIDQKNWLEIKKLFDRSLMLEPSSGWLKHAVGSFYMEHDAFLTSLSRLQAQKLVKESLTYHHPHQTAPYLRKTMDQVWKVYKDFDLLRNTVPRNALHDGVLLDWMSEQRLWQYRGKVYDSFKHASLPYYEEQCALAWDLLEAGKHEYAFRLFNQMYWMRHDLLEAQIGRVTSAAYANIWNVELENHLKLILEDVRYSIEDLQKLSEAMEVAESDYLKGLYLYRIRKYAEAIPFLKQSESEFSKVFLAAIYWKQGNSVQAQRLIEPFITESSKYLKLLILLEEMSGDFQKQVEKARESLFFSEVPKIVWRNVHTNELKTELNSFESLGAVLAFKPGKVSLQIKVEAKQGESNYLIFRVWDSLKPREVGTLFIENKELNRAELEFETPGGYFWIFVELAKPTDENVPGLVELGEMTMEFD